MFKKNPPDTIHIKFASAPKTTISTCMITKFDTKEPFDGSVSYARISKTDEHTGIRAKPLEFEKFSDGEYVARAFGYDYWITGEDGIIWQLSVGCGGMDFYNLDCKTLEGAKDAANKHFRVQLSEWLEDVT